MIVVDPGVFGIPVIEDRTGSLSYDEMFLSSITNSAVVGELAHFKYRMVQLRLNAECRKAATAHIEATASRLLGEGWKVSPR